MTPKRGDDVAPPPVGNERRLRFATNEATKGWGDLCAEAPGNTRRCYWPRSWITTPSDRRADPAHGVATMWEYDTHPLSLRRA